MPDPAETSGAETTQNADAALHGETVLRWERYLQDGFRALRTGKETPDTVANMRQYMKEIAATGAEAPEAYLLSMARLIEEARGAGEFEAATQEAYGLALIEKAAGGGKRQPGFDAALTELGKAVESGLIGGEARTRLYAAVNERHDAAKKAAKEAHDASDATLGYVMGLSALANTVALEN